MKKPKPAQTNFKKFPADKQEEICCYNEKKLVAFSFKHFSEKKERGFTYFKNELREELAARNYFFSLLQYFSSMTQLSLMSSRKDLNYGFEILQYWQVDCPPKNKEMSNDSNICVFRFGNSQKFRMFGFFEKKCQAFNVIGFDFGYSAYDHGS